MQAGHIHAAEEEFGGSVGVGDGEVVLGGVDAVELEFYAVEFQLRGPVAPGFTNGCAAKASGVERCEDFIIKRDVRLKRDGVLHGDAERGWKSSEGKELGVDGDLRGYRDVGGCPAQAGLSAVCVAYIAGHKADKAANIGVAGFAGVVVGQRRGAGERGEYSGEECDGLCNDDPRVVALLRNLILHMFRPIFCPVRPQRVCARFFGIGARGMPKSVCVEIFMQLMKPTVCGRDGQ